MPFLHLDPALSTPIVSTAGAPLTSVGETLASLQEDLIEELGNRDPGSVKTAKWINRAYKYLASILDIKQLFASIQFNSTANQPIYQLPANVAWVRELSVVDPGNYPSGGYNLIPIDADTYRKLSDDDTNLPANYFREGNLLVLYPTPREVKTYALEARIRPAPLVNPTDSPIIPPEYHEALLLRAKHVAFRALKSYTESGIARNDMISDLRGVEDSDANEDAEIPRGVRPIRDQRDYNRLR